MVNITEMELKYLQSIRDCVYFKNLDSDVWTDYIDHGMGKSARGVASSLVQKGIIYVETGKDDSTELTPKGKELFVELGLWKKA
jgi:predicted transcriptional regulator